MRRLLLLAAAMIVMVACAKTNKTHDAEGPNSHEPTERDIYEEREAARLQKAKDNITKYCEHAYRDYQPKEWFNMDGNDKMKDPQLWRKYTELLALRDEILNDSIPHREHPRYEKHQELFFSFMNDWQLYDHSSYCLGHGFSHDIGIGRRLELIYFILLPPDMLILSLENERPNDYTFTLVTDYGSLDDIGERKEYNLTVY